LATSGAGSEFVSITSEAFWRGLDQLEQDLGMRDTWTTLVVGSATVMSVAASTGFVVWVLRGGYLLTFMISSLPAWMMVDPMAVLDSWAQSPQGSSGEAKDSNKKLDDIFSDLGTRHAPS
ncbi:MAG: hypothetical protein OES79_12815, partial [Planctomycetota bacterium]|nr:hypothetical protein [Planctomycetota bacterium]